LNINPNLQVRESQAASQVESAVSAKQTPDKSQSAAVGNSSDRANFSAGALQLSNLSAAAAGLPAIRQERVAAVTQSVQNGTFAPSNDQIANSLLHDFSTSTRVNE
jgi:flagellar biosynthesis anti-sigma factor FlgM